MPDKTQVKKENQQRVIVFLNREQVDFLDKLGKDTLFSGNKKLPRTKIISALVDLLIDLNMTDERIVSLDDLKQKIRNKIGVSWPSTRELLTFKDNGDKSKIRENRNG